MGNDLETLQKNVCGGTGTFPGSAEKNPEAFRKMNQQKANLSKFKKYKGEQT